jgi:hypothetical protein
MSAKAPPRCKVCKELVKGHKGKPGVGNCRNVMVEEVEKMTGARRKIVHFLEDDETVVDEAQRPRETESFG